MQTVAGVFTSRADERLGTIGIQKARILARHDLPDLHGLRVVPLGGRPRREVALSEDTDDLGASCNMASGWLSVISWVISLPELHALPLARATRHPRPLATATWLGPARRST